jgi:hypothetical protein
MMETIGLIIDFGMLVLIWMVQLLIYPGFKYFERRQLIIWHAQYTRNMTFIVMPLMLGQLLFHTYQTYMDFSMIQVLAMFLVVLSWILTFTIFIPLHQKISSSRFENPDLQQLEVFNWWRTIIWTAIFVLALVPK